MVPNKKLLLAILGLLLLLGAAAIIYGATARPRADIAATRHDFGTVSEDHRPEHQRGIAGTHKTQGWDNRASWWPLGPQSQYREPGYRGSFVYLRLTGEAFISSGGSV